LPRWPCRLPSERGMGGDSDTRVMRVL